MKKLIWIAGLIALICSCGGKDAAPGLATRGTAGGPASDTGGRRSIGGSRSAGSSSLGGLSAGGDTGSSAGGSSGLNTGGVAGQNILEPTVVIESPGAVSDPDNGTVLYAGIVDVLCKVTQSSASGASAVLSSSVKIDLLDASGNVVSKMGPTGPTNNANEYDAKVTLSSDVVPAGRIGFRCKASDVSTTALTNSDTIFTFVDYGPNIKVIVPTSDMSAYPLISKVHFDFQVNPVKLASTDQGAIVAASDVKFQVYGLTIPTKLSDLGDYTADVDFSDTTLFNPSPSGIISVDISASNQRSPKATATNHSSIVLDGDPPTITITSPPTPVQDSVIGGQKTLAFTVQDSGSGVDPASVKVKLNDAIHGYDSLLSAWKMQPIANTTPTAYSFSYSFDSKTFPNSIPQIIVSIQASDLAGNVAPFVTRAFYLDNEPPFVSLDPPNMRLITHSGTSTFCSAPSDPLGYDAANNGSLQQHSGNVRFRSFVWDRTNNDGAAVLYFSGVDSSKVYLYLRPEPNDPNLQQPIIVHSGPADALNLCDSIQPEFRQDPATVQSPLNIISLTGSADFTSSDFTGIPAVAGCTAM